MRYLLPFFFLTALGCCHRAAAQETVYKLTGFIGIQGGESFTYELQLKDSTANLLSGYAYTYLQKNKDVKAYITAEINRSEKTLRIRERSIIYNHGFTSKAVMCLVNSELRYSEREEALAGKLTTMTAGAGALACAEGGLTFINKTEIFRLFNGPSDTEQPARTADLPPHVVNETPKKEVRTSYVNQDSINKARRAELAARIPPKPAEITEGKDKTYEWQSSKVVMEIWDGNNEDNDRVTVECNGQVVLSNYTLRNKKHTITIDISNNELNIINIQALNEGGDPPNTANIRIWDGETGYDIVAHNHTDKKATIKIKRNIGK
ncbi:MAG: hypothetical protein BGO09_13615 [Bacteroidetes bacterium 47-18]|nr:MAG: hypothetical protein BGO09_13615 [Bacteroidetes bacterium 47-18]